MDQEIVDYIVAAQKHGLADFEIKENLLKVGWEAELVEQSFAFAKAAETRPQPPALASPAQAMRPMAPLKLTNPVHEKPISPVKAQSPMPAKPQQVQEVSNLSRPSIFKSKLLWLTVIVLLILGGSAYGYYAFVYTTSPTKVFNNYLQTKKIEVYKSNYTLSYSFIEASSTKPVSATVTGKLYNDFRDSNNIQTSNSISINLKDADQDINGSFQYLLLGKILYLDISQIPQLKQLAGITTDWVKLDLSQGKKYVEDNSSSTTVQFTDLLNADPQLKTKLLGIWAPDKLIKPGAFLAKETLSGQPVYHIKLTLDNQALAQAVLGTVDVIQANPKFKGDKFSESDRNSLRAVLAKLTLKQGELWIGQKDSQLYRAQIDLSLPSLEDLSTHSFASDFPALSDARAKSRDGQRLLDVTKIQQAMQLYFFDHQGYPTSDKGAPKGFTDYLNPYPTTPKPPDGTCTDYFNNNYYYIPRGQPKTIKGLSVYPDFTVSFCLGQATGGHEAGVGLLSPEGIKYNIPCPTTMDKCVSQKQPTSENFLAVLQTMPFSAELKLDVTNSDFGKTQKLEAPSDSTDLLELIKSALSSFMSAFEGKP